jgi:CysZ protein
VAFLTPFAEPWDPFWRGLFRGVIALALLVGFVLLAVVTFTGLTLLIGDPFYERIWRSVELELGGELPGDGAGFWRGAADAVRLGVRATLGALLVTLIGLIPVVGTVVAAVLGVFFSGRLLATELLTRPLESRGLDRRTRAALMRGRRARSTGFGIAVQLCFLVPGGAILVMPAAVAGSTHLARDLISASAPSPAPGLPS